MNFFYLLSFLSVVVVLDAAKIKVKKFPNPYYGHQNAGYDASKEEEEGQDLSKIPGEPGVDYPLYHKVPETSFSCNSVPFVPGMYANVETGCQAYHVCHDGREGHQGAAFLCSNGTLFNQKEFACDWWYKVDCQQAPSHYRLNGDVETNPFVPKQQKPQSEEELDYYKTSPQVFKQTPAPYYQSTPKQYYTPQYYNQQNEDY